MFNLINIGERSGSGVPNIFNTWEDEGWKEPVIEERFDPDRTILTLEFVEKQVRKASEEQQHLCIAMAKDPEDTDMETIRAITGVNQILNQFPKKLLQEMVDDGWNVLVTNKVRKTSFNSFEKQMEIPRGNYQVQTYRMMARYLNERSGYLCYRYEFYEKVYRPESGKFYHNYKSLFEYNPDEYFADALYRYMEDGDRLHGLCQETWQFIHDILSIPEDTVL